MRSLLVSLFVLTACAHTEPAADTTTALNRDLQKFCSSEARSHLTSPSDFFGWYAPQVESKDVREMLESYQKTGSVEQVQGQLEEKLKAAAITDCPTRDAIFSPPAN